MTTRLQNTIDTLSTLISYPTVSTNSNLNLIHHAADRLDAIGARIKLIEDDTGTKANLFASIGPDTGGGIVLSGHSDVVPVEGQTWSTDPFAMIQHDDKLYGRGSCDMKGFIAACLAMAPEFAQAPLTRPIHFCFSYDEEVGCLGAQKLVREMQDWPQLPSVAIIGEPTQMRVIEGHKGCCEYTTTFKGLAGHGSRPDQGVNAVEYAVRYISKLMELRTELIQRAPANSRFEPPYTTLQVGRIQGGQAHNIVPWACEVDWEMRPVQDQDKQYILDNIQAYCEDVLLPAMRSISPEANITTQTIGDVVEFAPMDVNEAKTIVSALTGSEQSDVVSFGTEAGLFQTLGMSAVICGPGSIDQAHKPDEYIAISELASCLDMLEKLQHRVSQ